jgi:hypothetical protein
MVKMRKFDYDGNEDFQKDIDGFFEDEFGEEMFENEDDYKKEIIRAMELEVAENGLNIKLLNTVITMLEKSFAWRFYSFSTKIKMIQKSYTALSRLVDTTKKE